MKDGCRNRKQSSHKNVVYSHVQVCDGWIAFPQNKNEIKNIKDKKKKQGGKPFTHQYQSVLLSLDKIAKDGLRITEFAFGTLNKVSDDFKLCKFKFSLDLFIYARPVLNRESWMHALDLKHFPANHLQLRDRSKMESSQLSCGGKKMLLIFAFSLAMRACHGRMRNVCWEDMAHQTETDCNRHLENCDI